MDDLWSAVSEPGSCSAVSAGPAVRFTTTQPIPNTARAIHFVMTTLSPSTARIATPAPHTMVTDSRRRATTMRRGTTRTSAMQPANDTATPTPTERWLVASAASVSSPGTPRRL